MTPESCFTVLLIDDSLEDRIFVRRCLEQDQEESYRILEASTGKAGLDLCQQHSPDVILLNYFLPDCNGLDLLRQFQEQQAIPVIVLVEQGKIEGAVQAMQGGAENYLIKTNLSPELLCCIVRRALNQSRWQQQCAQQQATIARQLQIQTQLEERQFCLRLINTITADRTADLTAEQVIQRILGQVHSFYPEFRVRYCHLDRNNCLRTQVSLQPAEFLNCTGMEVDLGQVPDYLALLRSYHPLITSDVLQELKLAPIVDILQQSNIRAMLAVPLHYSDTDLGLLSLACDQCRDWSPQEVQTLTEIADFLSFAVQAAHKQEQRSLVEAGLLQSEAMLKEAQRLAHIGSWEFDVQTQAITWSEELYRMFGLDPDQPVPSYLNYLQTIHPDDRPNLVHCVEQAIAYGAPYRIEYRAILPDGSIRYHEGQAKVAKNAAGQVIKLFGIAMDITERKLAEAALRESEAQNRAILSATPDIMAVLDANGMYLSCSINRFTGQLILQPNTLEPLDPTGMQVTEVLPPKFALQSLLAIQQVLNTGEMQVYEQQHQFGDQIQYEEVRMVPYREDQVLSLVRNITDRKQAEAQLAAQNELLARIAQGEALSEILNALIQQVEHILPEALGAILLVDQEHRLRHGTAPRLPNAYVQAINGISIDEKEGSCGTAAFRKQPVIAADIATDRLWDNFKDLALSHGLRACWSVPIAARDGQVLGTFAVYYQNVRSPRSHELDAIVQMAHIAGIAIEREQTEAKIRQGEEQLQLTLEFTEIGAWSWHPSTGEYHWNGKMEELLELPPGLDNMFQIWFDRIHPEDADHIETSIHQALSTQSAFAEEYRYRLLDGRIVWRWVRGQGIYTETGELERVLGVVQDIDDRKQAEVALRQSEAKNRAMLATIPDLLLRVKRDGTCLDFIPPGTPMETDFMPIQSHISEVLPPEMVQYQLARMEQALVTGELQVWEQQLTRFGELRHEEVRLIHCEEDEFVIIVRDITERKQAELALQRSQAMQNAIIQAIPDLLIRMDQDGCYCEMISSQHLGVLLPDRPISESTIYDMLPAPLAEQRLHYARLALTTGKPQMYEQTLEIAGQLYCEEVRLVSLTEREVLTIVRDITDRKQVDLALKLSQERLQTLINAIPFAVWVRDADSRIVLQNPTDRARYGDLLGTNMVETGEFLAWQTAYDQIKEDYAFGEFLTFESVELIEGEEHFFLRVMAPLPDIDGGKGMFGVAVDITDLKRAEQALNHLNTELELRVQQRTQELHQQTQLLQSERLRLQLALEAASMGTWSCNLLTGQLLWSDRAQEIFGFRPGTFPGYQEAHLARVHPEDLERVIQSIAHTFATGAPYNIEYRIQQLNGEVRWIAVWGIVPQDTDSERHLIGVVCDITDRKQAEDALQQLNQELEQRVEARTTELQQAMEAAEAANRAKGRFLANMSHELRTPLNAILGFAQLMSRDLSLETEKRNQLSIINRSGNHLLNLINDILEMSKIEAGRIRFTPISFNLDALLDTIEAMFRLKALEKRLQFLVDRCPGLPQSIETDETKLRQVLINLVGNAIKFTKQGQVILRVSIGPQAPIGDQGAGGAHDPPSIPLNFAVEDSGIGIDPTELESLFEPFIQSNNRSISSQEGTGLGLPISRQFVNLMGGDLTVQSRLGVGSIFAFSIPVRSMEVSGRSLASPVRPILRLAPDQQPYRVLVVEDHETNQQLLIQLLQSVGFEVEAASNGQEAIALWETWHPQLIWMDMRMPIMDGYEATRWIRSQESQNREDNPGLSPPSPPTIIIALTANAFEEDRAKVLEAGCNDFIRKPFQETELLEKMAQHLGAQYVYTTMDEPIVASDFIDPIAWDPIAELRKLPMPFRTQLYQATLQLDHQRLTHLIEQMTPAQPALATLLREKLHDFALEQILELLQDVSEQHLE